MIAEPSPDPPSPPPPEPTPPPEPLPPAVEPRPTLLDLTAALPLLERGERIILIGPDGRPAAALVSVEFVIDALSLREDVEDARAIDEAWAEQEASGEPLRSWDEVKAELGL